MDRTPVWFLAGTDGSFEPLRECVVPEDKYVLLPVINMIYWEPRSGSSCSALQAGAAVNNQQLASATVLLNGESLGDIRLRRVRSEGCFPLQPDDSGSRLAASDGYWLMLKPLPRGRHTLVVAANYGDTGTGYGGMRQNFEYVLHVGSEVLLSTTSRDDQPPPEIASRRKRLLFPSANLSSSAITFPSASRSNATRR
jgi:hypothetical protein